MDLNVVYCLCTCPFEDSYGFALNVSFHLRFFFIGMKQFTVPKQESKLDKRIGSKFCGKSAMRERGLLFRFVSEGWDRWMLIFFRWECVEWKWDLLLKSECVFGQGVLCCDGNTDVHAPLRAMGRRGWSTPWLVVERGREAGKEVLWIRSEEVLGVPV